MLYKCLCDDGWPCHGGTARWSLPTRQPDGSWTPGEWMPEIADVEPCERGYHLCRSGDLVEWLGPTIYEAEIPDGATVVEAKNKIVVSSARLLRPLVAWTDRTAREFACDCAERALPMYERDHPDDYRPRNAVQVARRYARGESTKEELAAAANAASAAAWAARAAAWAAAWAARAAARAAAWAAWDAVDAATAAAFAVDAAAWDAARDAVDAAAWDAARDAARAAERHWQTARLMKILGLQTEGT